MAELDSRDVVNSSQSVGDLSPSDVPATTSQINNVHGEGDAGVENGEIGSRKENGIHSNHTHSQSLARSDDQALEDGTARSDTDTSRADASSVGDGRSVDAKAPKKFAPSKPVSFAKYSVPKVIAASAAKTATDKAPNATTPANASPLTMGRPRLVAKTTSTLTQKVKPFKTTAPDPMQVWNKNRATPQQSTKHLTDEELKQQYGIHLTSRIQSDGDGKESKWADIDDDDEDDWAPETIEWGDGTKTTIGAAEAPPAAKSEDTTGPPTPATEAPKFPESKPVPTFSSSLGPNATVLKLGASAERQQAQKAAQSPKGLFEKAPLHSSKTTPAPPPSKSPWAKLPPVEKHSPIEVKAQLPAQPVRYPSNASLNQQQPFPNAPAAQEISADDFNRTWRDSQQTQSRELFMPNSGRYETVQDPRRRMSRNEQGFRAPAVLTRPSQDARAPEPSAAFQTTRTSTDAMRRRASSITSGGSGQLARRMSIKSGEHQAMPSESAIEETPVEQHVVQEQTQAQTPSQLQTPAYQAMGNDYMNGHPAGQTDAELQAQRAQQRKEMREQAELARKRRMEEEARLEAEKQERIRLKLLALGPDPKIVKAEQEAKAKAEAEEVARAQAEAADKASRETATARTGDSATSHPKPPQPSSTGETQQYGEIKVYPMDNSKKNATPLSQKAQPVMPPQAAPAFNAMMEDASPEPPMTNGVKSNSSQIDSSGVPEPIPRHRPVSDARTSWGRHDHRSQPISNLWGAPHNKALGNGTFDQTLAGYAPQDLSSRASSSGQGWMNGRTPTVGQSPQMAPATQHIPETRSQALQNMTSPEPQPLAINSEIDSMQPVRPPAPIGPPQGQQGHIHTQVSMPPQVNGYRNHTPNNAAAVAGWNSFHNVARVQERAENERLERELAERREQEKRGTPQPGYQFNETFKQVQLGDNPNQRHISSVTQHNLPASKIFGAVGSLPPTGPASQGASGRGSRFFPQTSQPHSAFTSPANERRSVTYSHPEPPRSPSPPPAEEYPCPHPLYEVLAHRPIIRLPPERAVVKLPPASPPTPPAEPMEPAVPSVPQTKMTWAARLSMPAPKPPAPVRGVSVPIVQNPSWQERFNGLLGRKAPDSRSASNPNISQPVLAVASASKEPLDVNQNPSASVSLPRSHAISTPASTKTGEITTKEVEDEEDLFEDREAGSLPTVLIPSEAPHIKWPRALPARIMPTPPDPQSAFIFMGSHWKEDKFPKQHFAIIRMPGNEKSVKKDLPIRSSHVSTNGSLPPSRQPSGSTLRRGRGGKQRGAPAGRAR